jgi:hypothetical protein
MPTWQVVGQCWRTLADGNGRLSAQAAESPGGPGGRAPRRLGTRRLQQVRTASRGPGWVHAERGWQLRPGAWVGACVAAALGAAGVDAAAQRCRGSPAAGAAQLRLPQPPACSPAAARVQEASGLHALCRRGCPGAAGAAAAAEIGGGGAGGRIDAHAAAAASARRARQQGCRSRDHARRSVSACCMQVMTLRTARGDGPVLGWGRRGARGEAAA